MREKISVIVPVYGVEKVLRRCVDSILAQTCRNFEFIIVDNGSTDRGGQIADQYAARDSRIKVITGRGAISARAATPVWTLPG